MSAARRSSRNGPPSSGRTTQRSRVGALPENGPQNGVVGVSIAVDDRLPEGLAKRSSWSRVVHAKQTYDFAVYSWVLPGSLRRKHFADAYTKLAERFYALLQGNRPTHTPLNSLG